QVLKCDGNLSIKYVLTDQNFYPANSSGNYGNFWISKSAEPTNFDMVIVQVVDYNELYEAVGPLKPVSLKREILQFKMIREQLGPLGRASMSQLNSFGLQVAIIEIGFGTASAIGTTECRPYK